MQKNIPAKNAKHELTMMLIYLSRFTEEQFSSAENFFAWKGYDFDVLNELDDQDLIRQGSHPSRNKSVYITDNGIAKAKQLLRKYGIDDLK